MATTEEDLEARVAALGKLVAERPTRIEVEQILEDSRKEFRDVALNAVNEIAETSRRGVEDIQQVSIASIEEMQRAGIDGIQKVVDAVSGIPEKLDNVAEKVNRLSGAYDLGKWVAAIVLGGLGYGIYHISDKLSEIVSVLGELANG